MIFKKKKKSGLNEVEVKGKMGKKSESEVDRGKTQGLVAFQMMMTWSNILPRGSGE